MSPGFDTFLFLVVPMIEPSELEEVLHFTMRWSIVGKSVSLLNPPAKKFRLRNP